MRRVPNKQHVCVGRVCDTDEASLVLQRGSDTNAGDVGLHGAVIVGTTHSRPRHHLTHRHAGVLQPQGENIRNMKKSVVINRKEFIVYVIILVYINEGGYPVGSFSMNPDLFLKHI